MTVTDPTVCSQFGKSGSITHVSSIVLRYFFPLSSILFSTSWLWCTIKCTKVLLHNVKLLYNSPSPNVARFQSVSFILDKGRTDKNS